MGSTFSITKVAFFSIVLALIVSLVPVQEVRAASLKDDQKLNDEFKDFRIETIGADRASFSFDTKKSDNGLDSKRLFYVLVDSTVELEDVFDPTSEMEVMLGGEAKYGLADPNLLLNMNDGSVLKNDKIVDLRSNLSNEFIDLQGLQENRNFRLYVGASGPEMDKPIVDALAESPTSDLNGRMVRVIYTGIKDDNGKRLFDVHYLNGSNKDDLFVQDGIPETNSGDLEISFGFDTSAGEFTDESDFKYNFIISNGVEINSGDSWILKFENGVLNRNQSSITNIPNVELISNAADEPINNLFNNDGSDGEIRFSTDPFPSLLEGIGSSRVGFDVSLAPDDQSYRYLRGITSHTRGEMMLRFENNITLTSKGKEQIQLIGPDGKDYRDYDRQIVIDDRDNSVEIPFVALDPNKEYYASIPADSLALRTDSFGLGQFNNGSEFNKIIFYTEKKPSLASTYFSPGMDTFDHTYSPFSLNPSNDIYRIPRLVGVNKLGVGLNQLLVLQFNDKIVLNGNPDGKLKITSSGDNRNLTATAKVNETNPTELIITIEHGDNNLDLLRPNVIYDLVIEPGVVKDHYGGSNFAQNDTIDISFKTADGFKNAFLDKSSYELNSGLLQTPSHNIAIDIPKVYIRNVETIHYRQGLAPEAQVAPNLTNIDVEADPDVAYMTITTNQDKRDMLERGANGKFTATFAGLSADVTELEITAYDKNENELVSRIFRLQGAPGAEFTNDYVPEITDVFGKRISLYELMEQPELMQQVLEQIPVSELNRIGVMEPYFAPYNLVK